MAEEKPESEEEYDDAEVDLDGVVPEDDVIEDVEDGEIFEDDDDDDFDDDFDDDDDEDASLEAVAESEEDDDEVEADLSAILQERISADDDEENDAKSAESAASESSDTAELVSAKEDEVLCQSCFTLVQQSAIDEEGACPNCGAEI